MTLPNQHTHEITDFSPFDETEQYLGFSYVEKYPLLYSEDGAYRYFCIKDPEVIAAVICKPTAINNKTYQVIHRSWVAPEYRNRGYMKAMIYSIHNQEMDAMMSDDCISPQSLGIWRELCRVRGGKVIDLDTGEKCDDYVTESSKRRFLLDRTEGRTQPLNPKFSKPLGGPSRIHLQGYQYFIENRYLDIHPKTSK